MRPPWRITHIRVSDFVTYPSGIFFDGVEIIGWGCRGFAMSGYFYNLVIFKVIINTLLCKSISRSHLKIEASKTIFLLPKVIF